MNELAKQEEGWSLAELEARAEHIVKSKFFPAKTVSEAVALMMVAESDGIHPMRAMKEYHVIQGRPALRADAMLARFIEAGGTIKWHEISDERVSATFKHPQGGEATITWDLAQAKKAGLVKPNSGWTKYPRAMLRSRVVSEGVRTIYPGVNTGVYTPEEVEDFDDAPVQVKAEPVGAAERPRKTRRKKAAASDTKEEAPAGSTGSQPAKGALTEMGKALNAIGLTEAATKLAFARVYTGNASLETAKDLTKAQVAGITNAAKQIAKNMDAQGVGKAPELRGAIVISYLEKAELPPTSGPYGDADVVDAAFNELEEEA